MNKKITSCDCCISATKPWLQRVATNSTRQLLTFITLIVFSGIFGGQLMAFTPPPNTIGLSIEGCRNDGSPPVTPGGSLPNTDGRFVCQDPTPLGGSDTPYTPGNLGKGWNELDLVPFRLILTNSGAQTTYNVTIAADKIDNLTLGYDVITEPEVIPLGDLNGFSHDDCMVTSTPQGDGPAITGGADVSLFRELTITHPAGATCVIDYAQRLSIESSDYNGSNLQAYKFESDDFKTGKATIPLPVNQIADQELRKDMTATQDTDFVWNLTKQATPAKIDLGNTCDVNNDNEASVKVRVEWEILPGAPGMVMVVTNIYAKNPATRPITVNVSDTIFGDIGAGKVALDTDSSGDVVVPANTEIKVFEHTFDTVASVTDLMDTATATYIDAATGIPVPGQTEAMASAMIQPGTQTNTSAIVTDTESISGNGLQYSADSTLIGSADGSFTVNGVVYTLGMKLNKDDFGLLWTSVTQNGILDCADPDGCPVGFVEFNKTVYVDPVPAITTGTLSDTATLTASDGFTASSGPATIDIETNAQVKLTLVKTIPDILQDDETITCKFEVKNSSNVVVATPQFEFTAGETEEQTTIGNLAPDDYTVMEKSCGGLVPAGGTTQMVNLNLPICDDTVTFTNIIGEGSAVAEVNKVTLPEGFENGWDMTLTGPGAEGGILLITADNNPTLFERFETDLGTDFQLQEGLYTITEELKIGWENTAIVGCSFTINYPADFGAVKQCSFTNKKLGTIIINKVTDPTGGTGFGFNDNIEAPNNTFMLNDGGMKTFLDVSAGNYRVTEDDPTPEYGLVNLVCTDDATGDLYNVVDSSTDLVNREATINLDPGETVECTYTNRQRGMVTVLKTVFNVVDPNQSIEFTLTGPEVNKTDNTFGDLDGILDFDGVKLIPDESYKLCELVPAGWSSFWEFGGAIVTPYNPDAPTQDLGVRCYDFSVTAGQIVSFMIDNQFPGGDGRTPGYWKNWNLCTGGGQAANAERNGGSDAGFFLMEDLLPQLIGDLIVNSCPVGVAILDSRDINSNKKKANDAAYELARNLLAARLNLAAGAQTCTAIQSAVMNGQALLDDIGFDGTGNYLKPKPRNPLRVVALGHAHDLDEYNNNRLCP